MKLIDLLVQELPKHGGWPFGASECEHYPYEGNIDFYDEEGNWPEDCGEKYGYSFAERLIQDRQLGVMTKKETVTREQYEAALAASKQPVWCGDGLPPEGCECEVKSGKKSWTLCKVVHSSSAGVAFIYLEDPSSESSSKYLGVLDSIPRQRAGGFFRPLRTEAEGKREDAIQGIASFALSYQDAAEIYDAIAAGKIHGLKLAD